MLALPAITPVDVFEELRFAWELMAAAVLFLVPLAPARPHLAARLAAGVVVFSVLSQGYFVWRALLDAVAMDNRMFYVVWYVLVTFAIMGYLKLCFDVSLPDILYVGCIAYAAQHVIYVVVHELLALWLWTALVDNLVLYAAVSLVACIVWYATLYQVFARRLSLMDGVVAQDAKMALLMVVMLCALLACTFGFQHLFHLHEDNRANAVWMSLIVCLTVIALQYASFRTALATREKAASEEILREGARHWELSKALIENVNRTAHDLKHALRALDQAPKATAGEFVSTATDYIRDYQMTVWSEDEVLNTILSEKALLCESKGIAFSCSLGDVSLRFFSVPDLCVLLGNVIDNAIEGVSKLENPAERAISLQIRRATGLVLMTCDNPYAGTVRLREDGLPRTSKAEAWKHGYGLKSVRLIAEKYGGTLTVGAEGGVFTVQIAVPER